MSYITIRICHPSPSSPGHPSTIVIWTIIIIICHNLGVEATSWHISFFNHNHGSSHLAVTSGCTPDQYHQEINIWEVSFNHLKKPLYPPSSCHPIAEVDCTHHLHSDGTKPFTEPLLDQSTASQTILHSSSTQGIEESPPPAGDILEDHHSWPYHNHVHHSIVEEGCYHHHWSWDHDSHRTIIGPNHAPPFFNHHPRVFEILCHLLETSLKSRHFYFQSSYQVATSYHFKHCFRGDISIRWRATMDHHHPTRQISTAARNSINILPGSIKTILHKAVSAEPSHQNSLIFK